MTQDDERAKHERSGLGAEQQRLLEQIVSGRAALPAPERPPPAPAAGPEPLSPGQIELWIADQLVPGTPINNVACWAAIHRPVDAARLQAALDALVARHEALRATLVEVAGEPRWQLAASLPLALQVSDLRALAPDERLAAARAHGAACIRRPFDLVRGRLVHAALYQLDDARFELLVVAHHAVADGASMVLLFRDLVAIEAAGDRDPGLPALEATYTSLLAVQRQERSDPERASRTLAFWRELMSTGFEPVSLPPDHTTPRPLIGPGARATIRLAPELRRRIRDLQRTADVSWVSIVLVAVAHVLSRMSRTERVCIGVFASGRGHPASRDHVGSFSRIVPLPFDFSDRRSFLALVRDTHRILSRASFHDDVTATAIARAMEASRPDGRHPLFRVAVSVQPPMPSLEHCAVSFGEVPYEDTGAAVHDLLVSVFERADDLALAADYRRDAYDAATVESLLRAFEVLLDSAVAGPDAPVAALPLVRPDAWARWIARCAGPVTEPARDSVIARFEAVAARDPERVAVSCLGRTLSYAELDARATAVALELRARGVRRGDAILVVIDKTLCWPIAVLAILKTGAVYVPVGPTWPRAQIEFVIGDTRPVLAVVDGAGAERLRGSGVPLCGVDGASVVGPRPALPSVAVCADDLAYIIYTSGSTGRPKGVRVGHGGLSNIIEALRERPGIAADDVVLCVANAAFDPSISDLFVSLTSGARLAIAPGDILLDERQLASLIDREGTTAMFGTPSLWRLLLASGWSGKPDLVAWVSGEALPLDLARQLCDTCAAVWNLYGPTEASIWTTMCRVMPEDPRVTLGTTIRNAVVLVLDRERLPVPAGAVGEVWIAGAGVGLGYQDRPGLDADPFCDLELPAGRARSYRTGDLVRLRADDGLEFIGRVDHQVKLRGHRIELGHVEAAACEMPGITAAAAVVRGLGAWDEQLILYFVASPGGSPEPPEPPKPSDEDTVRRHLQTLLPAYMVPSRFVRLDRLPYNANGKLDVGQLPLGLEIAGSGPSRGGPLEPMERTVQGHWSAVLQREIDPDRQFFDQGGHSFLIVALRQRLEQDLGRSISTSVLYRHPTVRALAAYLTHGEPPEDAGAAMDPYRAAAARRGSRLAALRARRS